MDGLMSWGNSLRIPRIRKTVLDDVGPQIDEDVTKALKGEPGTSGMLSVEAQGYEPYRRELTLEDGQMVELSRRLRRTQEREVKTSPPARPPQAKAAETPRGPGIKPQLDL